MLVTFLTAMGEHLEQQSKEGRLILALHSPSWLESSLDGVKTRVVPSHLQSGSREMDAVLSDLLLVHSVQHPNPCGDVPH